MEIYRGTSRTAFVTRYFTLKAPNASAFDYLRTGREFIRFAWDSRASSSVRENWQLFSTLLAGTSPLRGLFANRLEAVNSRALGNNVVPTWFSLFGLVNIMASAQPCAIPVQTFRENPPAPVDTHTFWNPKNYGWHNGQLKLVDYGSGKAIRHLLANAADFRAKLNYLASLTSQPQ
jgi:hypothetical protein